MASKQREFNCVIEGNQDTQEYSEYKLLELAIPGNVNSIYDQFRRYNLSGKIEIKNFDGFKSQTIRAREERLIDPLAIVPGVFVPYHKDSMYYLRNPRIIVLNDGRVFINETERETLRLEKILREAASIFNDERNQINYDYEVKHGVHHTKTNFSLNSQ